MDEHITRALELGVAFMMFVAALSTFLLMYGHMINGVIIGKEQVTVNQQIGLSRHQTIEEVVDKTEMYLLLTNTDLITSTHELGGHIVGEGTAVKVFIDGYPYPIILGYKGERSLRQALQVLSFDLYTYHYVIDDFGQIAEIHLTGR